MSILNHSRDTCSIQSKAQSIHSSRKQQPHARPHSPCQLGCCAPLPPPSLSPPTPAAPRTRRAAPTNLAPSPRRQASSPARTAQRHGRRAQRASRARRGTSGERSGNTRTARFPAAAISTDTWCCSLRRGRACEVGAPSRAPIKVMGLHTLWRHDQAAPLAPAPVHRLDQIDHLLLVVERPVDLDSGGVRSGAAHATLSLCIRSAPLPLRALLLLPVPRSTMMCLLRKKNITLHGSYSSYMALKSGTWEAANETESALWGGKCEGAVKATRLRRAPR